MMSSQLAYTKVELVVMSAYHPLGASWIIQILKEPKRRWQETWARQILQVGCKFVLGKKLLK